jgi:hypothetical protein
MSENDKEATAIERRLKHKQYLQQYVALTPRFWLLSRWQ